MDIFTFRIGLNIPELIVQSWRKQGIEVFPAEKNWSVALNLDSKSVYSLSPFNILK